MIGVENSFAEEKWGEFYVSGKMLYAEFEGQKFFKIFHHLSNGHIEKLEHVKGGFSIFINDHELGSNLEIKIPRNFPVSNIEEGPIRDKLLVAINGSVTLDFEKITTECFYEFFISLPENSQRVDLFWTILPSTIPFKGEEVSENCIKKIMGILPPKIQIKNGINYNEILCKEKFKLIFKHHDNSPACVKTKTAEKLIERGWNLDLNPGKQPLCEKLNGEWRESTCYRISELYCSIMNGIYDDCPPSCPNAPKGVYCTQECIPTCKIAD